MNKTVQKVVAIAMLLIMLGSVIASVAIYFLS